MHTRRLLSIAVILSTGFATPAFAHFATGYRPTASTSNSSASYSRASVQPKLTVKPAAVAASSQSSSRSSTLSRRSSVSSRSSSRSMSPKQLEASLQLTCMRAAAGKREMLVQQSLDNFYEDMNALLEQRRTIVLKSWELNDARKRSSYLRTTWKTFGNAWRTAGQAMRDERRAAWDEYRDARTACGLGVDDDEQGGLNMDVQY